MAAAADGHQEQEDDGCRDHGDEGGRRVTGKKALDGAVEGSRAYIAEAVYAMNRLFLSA
jgi:hypothetical protein